MMEELQGKYDNIKGHLDQASDLVKAYTAQIKTLEEEGEKEGLILKNGIFTTPNEVYVRVYAEIYYNTYVGEKGAMYDAWCGAQILKQEDYDTFMEGIKEENLDKVQRQLDEFGHYENEFFEEVEVKDNGTVIFEYHGSDDQEEAGRGSMFAIVKVKESDDVLNIKKKRWDFVDEMKFEYDDNFRKAQKYISAL